MKRLLIVAAVLVAAVAWLLHSSSDSSTTPPSSSPSNTRASSTPTAAPASPLPASQPASAPLDRPAAQQAARAFLEAWARPDLPYDQWWRGLEPLVTDDAQESLSFTDPETIPPLVITGPGVETEISNDPYVATFYFPTVAGVFGVDIARSPDGGPWKAFSVIFPGGESQRQ